jgi:hypothetical protein
MPVKSVCAEAYVVRRFEKHIRMKRPKPEWGEIRLWFLVRLHLWFEFPDNGRATDRIHGGSAEEMHVNFPSLNRFSAFYLRLTVTVPLGKLTLLPLVAQH